MSYSDAVWDAMGAVPDEELMHVLAKLFMVYETDMKNNPADAGAKLFFDRLAGAIELTVQCNANRR